MYQITGQVQKNCLLSRAEPYETVTEVSINRQFYAANLYCTMNKNFMLTFKSNVFASSIIQL
jgi:hypothetical protein